MYFLDTATAVESVHAFFTSLAGVIPTDVTIQVESTGDVLDSETGDLTGYWVADPAEAVNCTGDTPYAAPVGAVINWLTSTIGPHRRLRGKSFIVPICGANFDVDGSLNSTMQSTLKAYGDTLIEEQSTSFVVWHRGTGTDGTTGLVTSCAVPDIAAVLRSRRD